MYCGGSTKDTNKGPYGTMVRGDIASPLEMPLGW